MRGEVWLVDFDPTRGREQSGRRPALVVSVDAFNRSPSGLVIALPITGTQRGVPSHVRVDPPEGGLVKTSFVLCEQIRSISRDRLVHPVGNVSRATMTRVEDRIRLLLGL